MSMTIKEKLKEAEKYICENFEELGIDDPVEEGYFEEYEQIGGASESEFEDFEKTFGIKLPEDFKELYSYKNGSGYFELLQCDIDGREIDFTLFSLEEMKNVKSYFQDRDALLTDYPEYFTDDVIEQMRDSRIKPYLFHKDWFAFATYLNCGYLMIDFDPDKEGKVGQVIFYIHDPDEIIYTASSIAELIDNVWGFLKENFD